MPIAGYDQLTAEQITARLPLLSQPDLATIEAYERGHRDRTTVLERISTLRGDEPWPGYDELTVAQVSQRLSDGDAGQVRRTLDYERAHKDRAGVMRTAERVLAGA